MTTSGRTGSDTPTPDSDTPIPDSDTPIPDSDTPIPNRDVPIAPWRVRHSPAKVRTAISRERIAEIALAIIDADGVDAVSMRRIAAELDTGAASLYAHVAGKDDVLLMAHDLVMDQLTIDDVTAGTWQDAIRSWARQLYALYGAHQDIARLSFADVSSGPVGLDLVERMLRTLLDGGLSRQLAGWLLDRVSLYIAADALEGWMLNRRFADPVDAQDTRSPQERGHDWFVQLAGYFRSLPIDRYPTLIDNVDSLMNGTGDTRFAFGIELLIAGAAALAGQGIDRPFDAAALTSGTWFTQ